METATLRLPLKGKLKTKADALKEHYGVESYAEMTRLLITEKYRELTQKENIP